MTSLRGASTLLAIASAALPDMPVIDQKVTTEIAMLGMLQAGWSGVIEYSGTNLAARAWPRQADGIVCLLTFGVRIGCRWKLPTCGQKSPHSIVWLSELIGTTTSELCGHIVQVNSADNCLVVAPVLCG